MVEDAVELQEDEAVAEEVETEEVEAEEGEAVITLDGEDSRPQKASANSGIRKRVNDLNKRNKKTNDTLQVEQEKSRLLQIALDQERENKDQAPAAAVPNPEDFSDGVYDPGYKKAYDAYTDKKIDDKVAKRVLEHSQVSEKSANTTLQKRDLEKRQVSHYEKAEELGVKDFNEAEDSLIEILGEENVNHIINNFEKSHVINYYLGKNPDKAEEIANLLSTNAIKAVAELGRLESRLKVKSNSNPPSNPDEELVGGGPATNASVATKHKKLVQKACSGKQSDMTRLAKYRKDMRAKGINL